MRRVLLLVIRGYQWLIRPLMRPSCRFHPSCSCYSHEAITRFGAWRGSRMTLVRLLRCHPWNPGGYDPVMPQTDDVVQPAASRSRLIHRLNSPTNQ